MRRRAALAVALALATPLAWAGPAAAHARLVSSTPAGGATVTEAPPSVKLVFDERIESSFGGVQVFDPAGARVPEKAPPAISGRTVDLPISPIDAAVTYTVVFRVISADGHPIEARFSFIFQPPAPATTTTTAAAAAAPPTTAPRQVDPSAVELEDAGQGTAAGLWAARALNYAALTLVVGLLLAAVVLVPAGGEARRASRAAAAAAALWCASALALYAFGLSTAAARPLPGVLTGDLLARFAETRFGVVLLGQAGVAALACALAALSRARPALIAAATGAAAPALWGHAGTDDVPALAVANDWAHVLGVTAWVGGLAALALLFLRGGRQAPVAEPAARFSRLAGWALAAVGATGVANTLLHLGGPDQLTDTTWGRWALVKLGLFAAIAGAGYLSRSRVLPHLREDGPGTTRAFARLATVELLLMAAAIGVATQMAAGVPADAEAASRVQSVASAFGDGQLNVTVEPARTGSNVVHLYVFDRNGQVDPAARDASLTLEQGARTVEARLLPAGPGHWSALNQRIPAKGEWVVRVRATTSAGKAEATGAVTVR